MLVPIYTWACLVTYAIGLLGDRLGHRGYINLLVTFSSLQCCPESLQVRLHQNPRGLFGTAFVGYIILIVSRSAALSYFAAYLAAA